LFVDWRLYAVGIMYLFFLLFTFHMVADSSYTIILLFTLCNLCRAVAVLLQTT
jgi:hypothetical protein